MKKQLDLLRKKFNKTTSRKKDPVQFIYRYKNKRDQELVGFLSAMFAYGRVEQILKSLEKILFLLGPSPHHTLLRNKINFEKNYIKFKHRLNTGSDLALLLYALTEILHEHESLQKFFSLCLKKSDDIQTAVICFIEELKQKVVRISKEKRIRLGFALHLLPSPINNGASKRVNLFLKWMIRKDKVDPGVWKKELGYLTKDLIIPLDIHIARHARLCHMTKRKSNDWKTAQEITDKLKKYDPTDPLKYDFAICHAGMQNSRKNKDSTHAP